MTTEKDKAFAKAITATRERISHGTDGPITAFVLVSRACDGDEVKANALYEELKSWGFLSKKGCIETI
jgi:hypothetical protein